MLAKFILLLVISYPMPDGTADSYITESWEGPTVDDILTCDTLAKFHGIAECVLAPMMEN